MPKVILNASAQISLKSFEAIYKNLNERFIEIDQKAEAEKEELRSSADESLLRAREDGVPILFLARAMGYSSAAPVHARLDRLWPSWRVESKRRSSLLIDRTIKEVVNEEEFSDFRIIDGRHVFTWNIGGDYRNYYISGGVIGFSDEPTTFGLEFIDNYYGDYTENVTRALKWVKSLDTDLAREYVRDVLEKNKPKEESTID